VLSHRRQGLVEGRPCRRRSRGVLIAAVCGAGLLAPVSLSASAIASPPRGASSSTKWSIADPPYSTSSTVPFAPLNAISAISPSDVWAVGQANGSLLTENWNGAKWSSVALPKGPCSTFEADCVLTGISGDATNDVIATGNGEIAESSGWVVIPLAFHWNGSAWAAMNVPSGVPDGAMEHVQAFSPTDAWAVGVAFSGSTETVSAVHWNGTIWTEVPTSFSTTKALTINAISGSSASDIWVVGETETGGYHDRKFTSVILHYDGFTWSNATVPDHSGLLDVDALSPTDAWAVAADGSILNWNGSTWTVKTQVPYASIVEALSPTDVWVGGIVSLAHYDGSSWSTTATPSGIDEFNGGAALTPGSIWFAGIAYKSNGDEVPAVLSTTDG